MRSGQDGEKSRRRAKPERLPARAQSQGPARTVVCFCEKLGRRWGGPRALGKAALRFPAEAVKGFRKEIYELSCAPEPDSLATQTVQSDLGGGAARRGRGVELPPAVCKRYCMGLGTWFGLNGGGGSGGGWAPDHSCPDLLVWGGAQRRAPQILTSQVRGPGLYLPAGGGLFGPLCVPLALRTSGPLHPVWELLGPDPPWRRWWGEALLPGGHEGKSSDPRGQMGPEALLEGSLLRALETQRRRNCAPAHRCGMGFLAGKREETGVIL